MEEVLQEKFGESCFLDEGHFTSKGSLKFAQIIAGTLKDSSTSF